MRRGGARGGCRGGGGACRGDRDVGDDAASLGDCNGTGVGDRGRGSSPRNETVAVSTVKRGGRSSGRASGDDDGGDDDAAAAAVAGKVARDDSSCFDGRRSALSRPESLAVSSTLSGERRGCRGSGAEDAAGSRRVGNARSNAGSDKDELGVAVGAPGATGARAGGAPASTTTVSEGTAMTAEPRRGADGEREPARLDAGRFSTTRIRLECHSSRHGGHVPGGGLHGGPRPRVGRDGRERLSPPAG